jgi:hypothetical protein
MVWMVVCLIPILILISFEMDRIEPVLVSPLDMAMRVPSGWMQL